MSEMSFEQMLEESFKTIRNGEVVEGQIQYEYRYDVYGNMLYYESHYWGHKIENEYVYR